MKNKIDKNSIIETVANIVDCNGIDSLTIKMIADKLGVKSPAIYKHYKKGIKEIKKELAFFAWKILDEKIVRNTVGKSKDDAIRMICESYRDFAHEHKGLFNATHWYNSYSSIEESNATKGIINSLYQVLDGYELNKEQKLHTLRFFRAFIQGYVDLEINGGFGDKISTSESFEFSLNMFLKGINDFSMENIYVDK